ncbi:MAG: hypothetical protein QOI12_2125 [Alphaproteobacteria bacterium]|nr:hypothetical protein [Alphaproteobacteria bacterium]
MPSIPAQVVLKPDALADAPSVLQAFRDAGFTTGPLIANNFSIEAPAPLFDKYFGDAAARASHAKGTTELPLDALPPASRDAIEAVVFTRPPDFGPGGNY